jgi:hypothetical protein
MRLEIPPRPDTDRQAHHQRRDQESQVRSVPPHYSLEAARFLLASDGGSAVVMLAYIVSRSHIDLLAASPARGLAYPRATGRWHPSGASGTLARLSRLGRSGSGPPSASYFSERWCRDGNVTRREDAGDSQAASDLDEVDLDRDFLEFTLREREDGGLLFEYRLVAWAEARVRDTPDAESPSQGLGQRM